MSPRDTLVHLNSPGARRLLGLPLAQMRVILAILALAPDGQYRGSERVLAAVAGLRPTELLTVLADLAIAESPLLSLKSGPPPHATKGARAKTPAGGTRRLGPILQVDLNTDHAIFIAHATGPGTPDRPASPARPPIETPVMAPTVRPRPSLIRENAALEAVVKTEYPEVAELVRGWLAHLAELPGGPLSGSLEFLQWSTVARLLAEYGPELVRTALESALIHVQERHDHPERYLVAAVHGLAESGRPAAARGADPTIDF